MSDNHLRLTEKDTLCPQCNEEYRSLSRHWGHKSSHRPPMDFVQHSIAAGLVLGGCKIDADGQTPALDIRTQYPVFAGWLYENLGWLANTIHRAAPGERQSSPKYIVRTVPHPEFDQYRRWRADDDRPPAAETIYSLYSVRVWVAKTAGVGWSGPTHSRTTRFHAETDARHQWYGAVLDYLGYTPYDSGVRYELDQSESLDLFDRIGPPVPGAGHKWLFEKGEYDARRRAQGMLAGELEDGPTVEGVLGRNPRASERKYPEREVIETLREADAQTDGTLTVERYANWRSTLSRETPSERSRYTTPWQVWTSLAGLERSPPKSAHPEKRPPTNPDTAITPFACPRCGARTTVEPHFPKDAAGQENRTVLRGCHACGWHENQ